MALSSCHQTIFVTITGAQKNILDLYKHNFLYKVCQKAMANMKYLILNTSHSTMFIDLIFEVCAGITASFTKDTPPINITTGYATNKSPITTTSIAISPDFKFGDDQN
jgi:hypothetical protein